MLFKMLRDNTVLNLRLFSLFRLGHKGAQTTALLWSSPRLFRISMVVSKVRSELNAQFLG